MVTRHADPRRDFVKVLRGRNEVDSAWVSFGFKCETLLLSCSLQFNGVEQVVNIRIVFVSILFNIKSILFNLILIILQKGKKIIFYKW